MRIGPITFTALLLAAPVAPAQVGTQPAPTFPQQPPPTTPQQPAPGTPQQPAGPAPVVPPPVVAPAITAARVFTAKTGMLFQSVRPERVVDFETVIGLLKDALEKSTDPSVQALAQGWRVFKATEPGPNGTVLYVFLIDPAVAGADYGLGRILADAYPDKIQEIWKLYTGSLGPGATLLNLTPVEGPPPPPLTTPAPETTPTPARPGPPPPG